MTIEDNTWSNWGNDWFASVQGQTPGVQEQHLTLTGNRLAGNGPVFEVVGTNRAATTEPHTNDYWTITNNAFQPGYYVAPYRGGDSVAAQLYDISDLTMTGNTFPGCTGLYESPQPVATCGAPSEYLMDLDVITYGTIENNNFSGMQGVVLPQSYPTYITDVTECDNKYGANAAQLDAPCAPPTTTVVLPANNARLSGTQYLDASASSGASGVVYELSGGGLSDDVVATGSENLYGWPAKWNTAAVPDGTYTLQSVASYAGGVTGTSPPVTVTVDNLPPTTTVVLPANNARLSGTQYLDASASSGASGVVYELSGGGLSDDVVATGSENLYGWPAKWNTAAVPDGTYTLQSVASYAGGVTGTSPPVTVTVDNLPPTTTVVLPANNARLSGTQYLDASASSGASGVVYELSGGGLSDDVVATGGENLYGWPAKWNTAAVPDGTYTLQSVASYAGGVTGTSPPVTVMIINQSRQDDRGRFRTPGGRPKWGGASL